MKRSVATLAFASLTALVGACGDGRSERDAERDTANLTVRFSHPREHTIRYRCSSEPRAGVPRCDPRKLRRLAAALKEHGRRDRVCTQLYGGPQRAFLTGTLRGEHVSARFTRVDGCAIGDYDALLAALGRPRASIGHAHTPRVSVPERDTSPPIARIVLAAIGGQRLAEASQPPGHSGSAAVELREPRLQGTALGEDADGGVARVRVSISERISCRAADGARFERRRTRYFPPPQIERIRATPGTRLPTTRRRSLRLSLVGPRCGTRGVAAEVRGELWGEAINGFGLEAVTPHVRFVYRRQ